MAETARWWGSLRSPPPYELDEVCDGVLISEAELSAEGVIGAVKADGLVSKPEDKAQPALF